MSVIVRDRTSDDEAWVQSSLRLTWGSSLVARLGELIDASALPGVVAEFDGERVGLATVAFRGNECKLVSLSTMVEGRGVGRALVQRCATDARAAGCGWSPPTTTCGPTAFTNGSGWTCEPSTATPSPPTAGSSPRSRCMGPSASPSGTYWSSSCSSRRRPLHYRTRKGSIRRPEQVGADAAALLTLVATLPYWRH